MPAPKSGRTKPGRSALTPKARRRTLGQELCPRYGLAQDELVWKALGYHAPITLTPFLTGQLDELRAKIRAAILKHAKRQESEGRVMEKKVHAPADSPRH